MERYKNKHNKKKFEINFKSFSKIICFILLFKLLLIFIIVIININCNLNY